MDSQEASAEAAHKAKNAQAAVETAREIQNEELVQKTAQKTKEALLEGLKEVFGGGEDHETGEMRVLVKRIPILCTNIENMHEQLGEMKDAIKETNDNIKWGIRVVLGAVILAILKLIFIP